eukprot:5600795-Amphidinium_carterae.1
MRVEAAGVRFCARFKKRLLLRAWLQEHDERQEEENKDEQEEERDAQVELIAGTLQGEPRIQSQPVSFNTMT